MDWPEPGTALITGASSGIGAAYARQLAEAGFDLIIVARRKDRLDDMASNLQNTNGINVEVIAADLSNTEDIKRVAARAKEIDDLSVLVSNAGFGTIGNFADLPLQRHLDMLNVHVVATINLCHAVLPAMKARNKGVIIIVSSVMSVSFLPGNTMYSSTKAFLKTFAENLALELKGTQVRMQALCPGFTDTEFQRVGDYEGWDRSMVPKNLWMPADEVVTLSLTNVRNDDTVVFVPGEANKKLFQATFGKFVKRRTS
jgi:short-subunit dehydrogenase